MHTLYIGGLPSTASIGTVRELLGDMMGLDSIRVIRSATGQGRGFAYVSFDEADSILSAQQLDGTSIGNYRLRVARAS